MKYEITLDGVTRTVDLSRTDDGFTATMGESTTEVRALRHGATGWTLQTGADRTTLDLSLDGDALFVLHEGRALRGTVIDPRSQGLSLGGGGSEGEMATAMPGAVVRVLVGEGDEVSEGQVLVVVEAMKMENEFKSPFAGVVKRLAVEAGQSIDAGTTLIVVEPTEA